MYLWSRVFEQSCGYLFNQIPCSVYVTLKSDLFRCFVICLNLCFVFSSGSCSLLNQMIHVVYISLKSNLKQSSTCMLWAFTSAMNLKLVCCQSSVPVFCANITWWIAHEIEFLYHIIVLAINWLCPLNVYYIFKDLKCRLCFMLIRVAVSWLSHTCMHQYFGYYV